MGRKIRAVVVGTGWPSWQHIKGYQKLKDVELSICDINKERCNQVADEYKIEKRFFDYESMLTTEKPDIVSICTPNYLHSQMTITALEQGINVLCEKPMAHTVEEAKAMIDAQARTGKILMIAHQRRFSPQAQYLKSLIDSGELGEVYYIRACWIRKQGIPGMGGWFTQMEKSGGGSLIDIGVHMLDLALWYFGHPEPLRVDSAWGSHFGVHGKGASGYAAVPESERRGFNVDDYVFAHVNYPGGKSFQLQCSWAGHIKQEEVAFEIWGSKGGARLYPFEIYSEKNGVPVEITPKLPDTNPFDEEIRLLIEAVQKGTKSPYNPQEGLKVVELIEKIYANGNSTMKRVIPSFSPEQGVTVS